MDNRLKIIHGAGRRMDFGNFVDKVFWLLITAAAVYAANAMREISTSISELNQKVAVVIYEVTEGKERADRQEHRIEKLEDTVHRQR